MNLRLLVQFKSLICGKATLDRINNSMMQNHSKKFTRDTIHHNQSSIGDTQSSRDLRGEVDVAGRVDQVDEETKSILTLLNEGHVIFGQLVVHGDGTVKEAWQGNQQQTLCRAVLDTPQGFCFVLVSRSQMTGCFGQL